VPVEAFDAQVAAIRANYETIMQIVEPEIIQVLNPGGSPRSVEDLYDLVFT
jgi:hypothetical protein